MICMRPSCWWIPVGRNAMIFALKGENIRVLYSPFSPSLPHTNPPTPFRMQEQCFHVFWPLLSYFLFLFILSLFWFMAILNMKVSKHKLFLKTYNPSRYCTSLEFNLLQKNYLNRDYISKSSLLTLYLAGWLSVQYTLYNL